MKDYLAILRKNIVTYMEYCGFTQTSLAEKIGVTNATVSKWVLGKSEPKLDYINAMCEAFHCTRSELVDEEQTPESIRHHATTNRLMAYFTRLNEEGTEKALQYFEDLNPKFYKDEE